MKTIEQAYIRMIMEAAEIHDKAASLVDKDGTKYTHPGGGYIDVKRSNTKWSPRKQSVVDFQVDEKHQGKGIGKALVAHALKHHDDLGAQASSPASVKVFHAAGFRNPEMPSGSVDDHLKQLKADSSVYMAHKDREGKKYVN